MSVCRLAPAVALHEINERSKGNDQAHLYFANEKICCLIPKRQSSTSVESLDQDTYICKPIVEAK